MRVVTDVVTGKVDPVTEHHSVSVCYKERYLKACAQQSLCRWYIAQSFKVQLLCNCDNRSII